MQDQWARTAEVVPIEQSWGNLRWLFDGERTPGTGMTLGVVEIAVGESNPCHLHPDCEEVLYLIEGELEHAIGDAWVKMVAGDAIRVGPGTPHQARNTGAVPARMIVAYDAPERGFTRVERDPDGAA